MKPTRVGCAGILVEDIFCGPLEAVPAEGSLTAVDLIPTYPGGCAANVAINLTKQGASVDILGCLGKDAGASVLTSSFQRHGIGVKQLQVSQTLPTSRTVILLINGQDRRYVHVFGANAEFCAGHFDPQWLRTLGILYLGGVFALPGLGCPQIAEIMTMCRTLGVKTVVDVMIPVGAKTAPENELRLILPLVDYFLPNNEEAQRLTGEVIAERQVTALRKFGARNVIVTQGAAGLTAGIDNQMWKCASYQMAGVDPSGAGDAFASGVIVGLLEGWSVPRLLAYASAIGASSTRKVGTTESVFTREEAEHYVGQNPLHVQASPLD